MAARDVTEGDRNGGQLTLDRAREIEEGRGEPPAEREKAELVEMHKVLEPIAAEWCRQVKKIDPTDQLAAAGELVRRWSDLSPSQRRRFGKARIRHAPRILRLLPRRAVIHVPQPRENRSSRPRERRAQRRTARTSRGDPDLDEPDLAPTGRRAKESLPPLRAGLRQRGCLRRPPLREAHLRLERRA